MSHHELDMKSLWRDLDEFETELDREGKTLHDVWLKIAQLKSKNDTEITQLMTKDEFSFMSPDTAIGLNVGGQMFETTVAILTTDPYSLLAACCRRKSPIRASTADGVYFFDRDWWLFRHILSYLRSGVLPRELDVLKELYEEASYYRLEKLQRAIEELPMDQVVNYAPVAQVASSGIPDGRDEDRRNMRHSSMLSHTVT